MTKFFLMPIALATSLMLGGCASLAPSYERPAAPVAARWPVPQTTAAEAKAADLGWREFFTDPRLQALIEQALANNRDLRVAVLNVQRAQAQYDVQQADRLPGVNAGLGQTAQRAPGGSISRQYSATLGVSAYELDLFGRVKSLSDAAQQQYLATADASHSAQISLVAQVAGSYLTLAADQERLRLAEQTLLARQDGLRLTQRLQGAGVASTLDLRQAEIAAESSQTDLASLTAQVAQDRNALELLVGQPLGAAQWPVAGTDAPVTQLAELSAGLPSEVLLARPDVQQAERTLQAANANIGAARAAFFPHISLTASAGTASSALDGLFRAGSGVWSFVPQVSLPIFDAGRNKANLKVAEVDRDIATAQYEKAVQSAFRDVADALAQRATLGQQVASQQRLVAQTQDALRLAEARFRQGLDDRLATLDAQRSLYAAEQGLISTRLAQQVNRVTLYKALGGGSGAGAPAPQSAS
ncbi:efflux transporter outer membrane subunit [Roseateles saccharophilus]|uniref:Multidrug efflux system outer membrane protein n=1 Tax=Roseateles saccharophilus TaxID=304 RepID=A0A4R3U5P6_ROSSA|nr:efflux transporter outer membrane subunit [Roseateles saccharophilus]MDG0835950.1 efflux transporter outer membrane subunit [Roseateles saccharophilus]TCU82623.1 multidrug efflux system outer membrane protein [Roseateles saccharophilus]